jgi:hypothetical protein
MKTGWRTNIISPKTFYLRRAEHTDLSVPCLKSSHRNYRSGRAEFFLPIVARDVYRRIIYFSPLAAKDTVGPGSLSRAFYISSVLYIAGSVPERAKSIVLPHFISPTGSRSNNQQTQITPSSSPISTKCDRHSEQYSQRATSSHHRRVVHAIASQIGTWSLVQANAAGSSLGCHIRAFLPIRGRLEFRLDRDYGVRRK